MPQTYWYDEECQAKSPPNTNMYVCSMMYVWGSKDIYDTTFLGICPKKLLLGNQCINNRKPSQEVEHVMVRLLPNSNFTLFSEKEATIKYLLHLGYSSIHFSHFVG